MELQYVRPIWVPDNKVTACFNCSRSFWFLLRKHHCRCCGRIFCRSCSECFKKIVEYGYTQPVRVCQSCFRTGPQKKKKQVEPQQTILFNKLFKINNRNRSATEENKVTNNNKNLTGSLPLRFTSNLNIHTQKHNNNNNNNNFNQNTPSSTLIYAQSVKVPNRLQHSIPISSSSSALTTIYSKSQPTRDNDNNVDFDDDDEENANDKNNRELMQNETPAKSVFSQSLPLHNEDEFFLIQDKNLLFRDGLYEEENKEERSILSPPITSLHHFNEDNNEEEQYQYFLPQD